MNLIFFCALGTLWSILRNMFGENLGLE